jgi:hypothetical protein
MKHCIFIVALIAVLTGCKAVSIPGLSTSGDDIVPVPPADARILFEAPAFVGQAVARAKFTDHWQREEYALFRGARGQAEIIYLAATARETSLETDVGLKTMIKRWNFNADSGITWAEEIKAFAAFGGVFALPYRQNGYSCFGFSSDWGPAFDDPETRPTKMVFGYYCEIAQAPLTQAEVEALIDNMGITTFAGDSSASISVHGSIQGDGGKIGNSGFPFLLARGYNADGTSLVDRTY